MTEPIEKTPTFFASAPGAEVQPTFEGSQGFGYDTAAQPALPERFEALVSVSCPLGAVAVKA